MFKLIDKFQLRKEPSQVVLLFFIPVIIIFVPSLATGADEVISQYFRSGTREIRARSYKDYEILSRYNNLPINERKTPTIKLDLRGPVAGQARKSTFQADAHWGYKVTVKIPPVGSLAGVTVFDPLARAAELGRTTIPAALTSRFPQTLPAQILWQFPQPMTGSDYESRTCLDCHPQKARNIHSARIGNACRDCHGEEPIAGINHYYSRMNPIRRHSYVCSKCHKDSSISFAAYMVHEPNPFSLNTLEKFPLLFYATWFMVAIAIGTFVVFLPLTFLWGLREFFPSTFLWGPKRLK